jgi:hypothetical protein
MEDSAQQQFSPPGTHCKFLGFDPKSNAAFVVHMDSDGMPVRRTTEILQRSYQESEVAFNIDPGNMVALADYDCLTENKPESENDSPVRCGHLARSLRTQRRRRQAAASGLWFQVAELEPGIPVFPIRPNGTPSEIKSESGSESPAGRRGRGFCGLAQPGGCDISNTTSRLPIVHSDPRPGVRDPWQPESRVGCAFQIITSDWPCHKGAAS